MGDCSFGIYLIEDYLRNGLAFIWDAIVPHTTMLPACVVWMTAVLIIGVIVVSFLKKIPGMNDLL